jgi:chaperone required for assembly of F1-ATPase
LVLTPLREFNTFIHLPALSDQQWQPIVDAITRVLGVSMETTDAVITRRQMSPIHHSNELGAGESQPAGLRSI